MKQIPLTQGKFALVDDETYDELNKFKWCANKTSKNGQFYAVRNIVLENKPKLKREKLPMHREILGITDSNIYVDHKDGNTLNNTKENLRAATPAQNSRNRAAGKNNSVGFRGVTKKGNKWIARFTKNKKRCHLGYYDTAEEAARAFDKAAKETYGEFCGKLNFENEKE